MPAQPAQDQPAALAPVPGIIMDLLAARDRLGETWWPCPAVLRPELQSLAAAGLVEYKPGAEPGTYQACLTSAGQRASGTGHPPASGSRVYASEYLVTVWPEDLATEDPSSAASWCVTVRRLTSGRWVVCQGAMGGIRLQPGGRWGVGNPETFTLPDAMGRAREWAPKIRVAGLEAADAVRRARAGELL